MPADIQTGTGVVWGVANDGTAIALTGYATLIAQNAKLAHKAKITDIEDAGGNDTTAVAVNEFFEMDVEFVLSGATRAAAAATGVFLAPLATVTITHFKISAYNGTWQYRADGNLDLANNAAGKFMLKLRRYADATQNTALTTVVTG